MPKLPFVLPIILLITYGTAAQANPNITVAYAGSMGVVMDRYIDPTFKRDHHITVEGIEQGAWALARLLASGEMQADVFISVTPGPIHWLITKGLVKRGIPVASTQMVIAYSPKSHFAEQFQLAAKGDRPWYQVLESKGLRFGRTDPETDPQGRNAIFTFQLAAIYYHRPDLVGKILGSLRNSQQIFTEPSLLSRLESGQVDAAASYLSAVRSRHLPFIKLPVEINLGKPAYMQQWYSRAGFNLTSTNNHPLRVKPQPLVFYAALLDNARHPRRAREFIAFLRSPSAQASFHTAGYNPPQGPPLS